MEIRSRGCDRLIRKDKRCGKPANTTDIDAVGIKITPDLCRDHRVDLAETITKLFGDLKGETIKRPASGKTDITRSAPKRTRKTTQSQGGEQGAARKWLKEHGVDVPARGRLSEEQMNIYRQGKNATSDRSTPEPQLASVG